MIPVFELSMEVNIVRNKLCDLKKEFDSFKITDALHISSINSLQETITNIQKQLNHLTNEAVIKDARIQLWDDMFVDCSLYKAFVTLLEGVKLKTFLKLPKEERDYYINNPDVFVEKYLKNNPGVFKLSLQAIIRKLIVDFSNKYNLSEQSGLW
jgi:hypothetical protein